MMITLSKPAPGDAAETKPSQHTKKFKRMFVKRHILNKRNIKDKKALQKAYDLLQKKRKNSSLILHMLV